MGATTGLVANGAYAAAATNKACVDVLLALIPDPDAPPGTGPAGAAGNKALHSYLDEISPAAIAELRVELLAMKDAIENVV